MRKLLTECYSTEMLARQRWPKGPPATGAHEVGSRGRKQMVVRVTGVH